ncbi:hypothetical protein Y032_0784g2331 [Ancylostoma ceylanicum]|uniref:Uncharacterized protein n=1 Tax=Ancylostoma ceylanicum TaxID=53326 RepID=A0A016WDZ5_9BILA|nr:hypothetical protein Y032_0784g2331 [Ancylostoma ceylanicum]
MSADSVAICTPGRSDDEPEPYYSPEKSYFEEKCEENSAHIAILEREILELRRAIEARMKWRRRTLRVMR